ncbi:Uncharacterized protein HZ326_27336, partial [Fusarium oxysporum f. sp. albedinis]
RMEPSKFAGCQGTPTSPATNRPTSWQRQRHRSQSPKALNRRWLTYEESQDRSPKKRSRRGGPPPLLSSTKDSISRRPQAARRSSRSRAQPCTICWQRDPSMGTSLRITRDSTTTTHAWSAHVADAKHRITSSTAERYRCVIG